MPSIGKKKRVSFEYRSGGQKQTDSTDSEQTKTLLRTIIAADIPDPCVREMIFGCDAADETREYSFRIGEICQAVTNIFWLGAIFAYFANFDDDNLTDRINRLFATVYNGENLSLDKAFAVFTEMQVQGTVSAYAEFIVGKEEESNNSLSEIYTVAKNWEENAESFLGSEQDWLMFVQYLIDAVHTFKYLQHLGAEVKTPPFVALKFDGEPVATHSCLLRFKVRYYYLHDALISGSKDKQCILRCFLNGEYYSLNTDNYFKTEERTLALDELRKSFDGIKTHYGKQEQDRQFRKLNFSYIHMLSLALSDIMGATDLLSVLNESLLPSLDRIAKEEIKSIPLIKGKNIEKLDWDQIFLILLVQCGPSEVIKAIVRDDEQFKELLQKLNARLPKKIDVDARVETFNKRRKTEWAFIEKLYPNKYEIRTLEEERAVGATNLRVQMLLDILRGDKHGEETVSIQRIAMLQKMFERVAVAETVEIADKMKYAREIFGKLFFSLSCFYAGCLAYAHENEKPQKATEEFLKAASKCSQVLRGYAEGTRDAKCAEFFRDLCARFDYIAFTGGNLRFASALDEIFEWHEKIPKDTTYVKKNRSLLLSLIGRSAICEVSEFDRLIDGFFTCGAEDIQKSEFKSKSKFYRTVCDLFNFLNYNYDYKEEVAACKQQLHNYDPIFPYIMRCKLRNKHHDGFNFGNCEIYKADGDSDSRKLLSENDYELNKIYYCIPNAQMSNKLYWIEPFLIDAREFTRRINISQ